MGAGRRLGLVVLCGTIAALLSVASAPGATIELTKYDGVYPNASIDGLDAVGAGTFNSLDNLDIDQSANVLYAVSNGSIYKFNFAGASQPFSALGGDTVFSQTVGEYGDLEVDNSATVTQGRIYAFAERGGVKAWQPSGEPVGSPYPSGGIAGFSDNCGAAVGPAGHIWVMDYPNHVKEYDTDGLPTGNVITLNIPGVGVNACDFDMDTTGDFYVPISYGGGPVYKFDPTGAVVGEIDPGPSRSVAIDPSNDNVYVDDSNHVNHYGPVGNLLDTFGTAEGPPSGYPSLQSSFGIAVDGDTHKVYVSNRGFPNRIDIFSPSGPVTIPDVTAEPATAVTGASATLHGAIHPDGIDTTDCHFEYGIGSSYNYTAPCEVGGVPTNIFPGTSGNTAVSAEVTGLIKGSTYHFKLTGLNSSGVTARSNDESFSASDKPQVGNENVTKLNADSAQLNADVDPDGGITKYQFEWGTDENYGNTVPLPEGELASVSDIETVSTVAGGLEAGTTYHYRVVAHNDAGDVTGGDHTFTTFAPPPDRIDSCENAHVRQQTGAALLLDCRAYELVSAADTGGYNVESKLEAGQKPFGDYPSATAPRVLYGVHSGAIPGPWNPTNRGVDPYIATRGADGWSTDYVGIPANLPGAGAAFASPLLEADPSLQTFAFGGNDVCSPCFADGSTNVPLRMPDGSLIKGMAGSLDPAADTSGRVVKHFSGDGSHFVFGATAQFESDGNSSGTDVTIYDRDLNSDSTQVVSKLPNGSTITGGAGTAELDISADGSRIVIGRLISTDAKGNRYYHLYIHHGASPNTIDLTPGTTSGALYDGMSADGTTVYFTTRDPLTTAAHQDADTSADIFRADVSGSGATLTRVSIDPAAGPGGAGNTDLCDPASTTVNEHWNVVGGPADCSATAIAGGDGIASGSGAIFFLSPEVLDDSGPNEPVENAPNLYLAEVGQPPRFVATLDSSLNGPEEPIKHHVLSGTFGSFESATGVGVAPNGDAYVYDIGGNNPKVQRFSSAGTLISTVASGLSTLPNEEITGDGMPMSIAVDPGNGDLYVPEFYGSVFRYNDAGELQGTVGGGFGGTTAIAVNPLTHSVYLTNNYDGATGFGPVFGEGPSYSYPELSYPRSLAFDLGGRLYFGSRQGTRLYNDKGDFVRMVDPRVAFGIAVNPVDNSVYLNLGDQIVHYTAGGAPAQPVEAEGLTAGRGIAVGPGNRLYVVQSGKGGEVRYYDEKVVSNLQTDNPAVIHATNDAGTRHTEDLQVSPDGRYAAFSSTLPLSGFNSRGYSEVFRFDADVGQVDCASCPATNGAPNSDTTLVSDGLSLSDDGRVFFDSLEPLVLRDTNERLDAYEWGNGTIELISPGSSPFNSRLLGVSQDGTDAYFFTRDTLVQQDENGTLTKIYDARAHSGFPYVPSPPPCRASDECHGAGSQAPGALSIGTISGSKGNRPSRTKRSCGKGRVRRGGRCVPKRRHGKHGNKRGGGRGGAR